MPTPEREKLEFSTNIPVEITLGKNFKSGTGQWGAWHGWNVIQDGVEKVIFAKDALHDKIKGYGEGARLTVTYAEKKGTDGAYHEWEVFSANGQPQSRPQKELKREYDAPKNQSFDLDDHLQACANIAQGIIDALGLKDDQARQACFATVCIDAQRHNIILGGEPKSETQPSNDLRRDAFIKGVFSACKLLNEEGYTPPLTKIALNEYVNQEFGLRGGLDNLSTDKLEDLIKKLSDKLDAFRANKHLGDDIPL